MSSDKLAKDYSKKIKRAQKLKKQIAELTNEFNKLNPELVNYFENKEIEQIENSMGKIIFVKPRPIVWNEKKLKKLLKKDSVKKRAQKKNLLVKGESLVEKVFEVQEVVKINEKMIEELLQNKVVKTGEIDQVSSLGDGTPYLRYYFGKES